MQKPWLKSHRADPLIALLGLCCGVSRCELAAPIDAVNDTRTQVRGCDALDSAAVLSGRPGGKDPSWGVALVKLAGAPECVYMDKTEVTVAEYAAWADTSSTFADWNPWCATWKANGPSNPAKTPSDTCVPSNQSTPFASDKPIRCVDWCDAEAYCRVVRAGHLCYRNAVGGSAQPENHNDEWPSACNNAGTTVWPWGDDAGAGICNIDQAALGCGTSGFSCGPAAVKTFAGCVTKNGIFDLIGNVREWLGVCDARNAAAADTFCETAGGGYSGPIVHACSAPATYSFPKSSRQPDLGFRCCYDLTPVQRQAAGLP